MAKSRKQKLPYLIPIRTRERLKEIALKEGKNATQTLINLIVSAHSEQVEKGGK